MQKDYDILIIGGGMVGASLACALGDSGLRIGVVESLPLGESAQPSYDARTVALAYGSRRIFEGICIWDRIQREGAVPIKRIHISDRGHFGFTRLECGDAGVEALGYVVQNRVLGSVLLESLKGKSNIRWLCPATMEAIGFSDARAEVTVRLAGKVLALNARLIVAADGADSAVREAAGIRFKRVDYDQSAIVTNVGLDRSHDFTAYERFTDSGPLALLPMQDNRCAVVWSARRHDVQTIMEWSDEEFLRALQKRFGDRLGPFRDVGKRYIYPLSLTRVAEHVRPRLALVGNAAHTVHPVAGQGFNLGLRDIATLSQVLVDARRTGGDIGDPVVLRKYADWRRRDNRVIATFTDGLVRVFSNRFPPLVFARDLGLIAVDLLPPVKRGLTRITSGLAGRLPRLARGLPLM